MSDAQSSDPSAPMAQAPPSAAPEVAQAASGFYDGQQQAFDPRRKSPRLAALLSFVPGVGQVYIGPETRPVQTGS